MKKIRKLLSIILTLCLALSLVPTAFADSTGETANATNFDDIAASDYYYEPVLWAVINNITTGTSESTFSPANTCTRGQIITFLWRAEGLPEPSSSNSFTDVSNDKYYYKAVQWAYENGIDESTGTFKPDSPCTRAMVVEYLWKLAGSPKAASEAGFTDVSSNASYADAVAWAVKQGITTGTSSTKFSPTDTCTRGQIVTFLYRDYVKSIDPVTQPSSSSYLIGIVQLIQHDALDAASQGFMDALTDLLGENNVTFDYHKAMDESTNCNAIVDDFVNADVDLIMANTSIALQAAAAATASIPILGTSITDYPSTLNIDDWKGTVGGNVSGTTDLAPLDQQADMIYELFPDAETIGLLYYSAELNSVYQCTAIESYLQDFGYEVERYSFTDINDIASVTQSACDKCDIIYVPYDLTVEHYVEIVANVVLANDIPVIASTESICDACGVAMLSISYYDLGYTTGEMAYEILVNNADISTMTVKYASKCIKKYNKNICELLNIGVPEDYTAIEI